MGETETDAAERARGVAEDEGAGDARRSAEPVAADATPPPGDFVGRYRRLPSNVLAIGAVSFLNDASSEIIYPFLSVFLTALGATPLAMGLIEGAAESVSSFLKLFAGYLSDRRGRRKGLVVAGYALAGAMRTLLALASTWPQVLALRLADRVGKGVRSAPRDAMIADAAAPNERGLAFGFHRAMDHAGAVAGPLIGFVVLYFVAENKNAPTLADLRLLFLVAAVPAFAAVLVAAFVVRESRREERTDLARVAPVPTRFSLRGLDSNFKRFLAVLALFTLANSSDLFILRRAQEAGVGAASIPLLWAALHVSKALSSLAGGDLSDRLGRKRLIVAGWVLYAAVYCGFAYVSSVGEAWALFLLYGVYFGLTEGAEKALVADLVRADERGTAYGLYNLAFSITVLPASLLMGALWKLAGARVAFLVSAGVAATAALRLVTLVRARPDAHARAATA
ncbi:MAG TPA: MFS transporter, partial [Pyrinomonadaceae bacterium]|nr:MFS transporter [Pyrinomonadaceae bacterium]